MTDVTKQLVAAIAETTEALRVLTLALRTELAREHASAGAGPQWPPTFDDDDDKEDRPDGSA